MPVTVTGAVHVSALGLRFAGQHDANGSGCRASSYSSGPILAKGLRRPVACLLPPPVTRTQTSDASANQSR
jgi:hypothetical protein